MTLAYPFTYWQRSLGSLNSVPSSDGEVVNRNEAANTTDLHVRSFLHTQVSVTTTTTSPPPIDWFARVRFAQTAQWTPAPVTVISTADEGNFGDLLAKALVLTTYSSIAAPGRDVTTWSVQDTAHARVYHRVPDDNADFPSVQSALTIQDPSNVLFGVGGYHFVIQITQFLETLWNSKVPPP